MARGAVVLWERRVRALAVIVSWVTVSVVSAQSSAQTQGGQSPERRKTSEPYTGDLSIFESPGRDKRLQVNRVMDILGITPGKTVADIGAGSGWLRFQPRRRFAIAGSFQPWTSIQ